MLPDNLSGMSVYQTRCQMEFVRWKRVHSRPRIAKKWRKRFGPVERCKFLAYRIGHELYVCPCVMAKLKQETTRGN